MVKNSDSDSNFLMYALFILIVLGIIYIGYSFMQQNSVKNSGNVRMTESAQAEEAPRRMMMQKREMMTNPSEEVASNVQTQMNGRPTGLANLGNEKMNFLPAGNVVGENNNEYFSNDNKFAAERNFNAFPKDQLSAQELLPSDNASQWAQVNPAGSGSLKDRNFLQSGYHIGINTVGQTLRNANLQVRSEPPCPQVKVSPWSQSTIEPDIGRKPFEIGGC